MPKHLMNKKLFSYDFNKSEIDEINFKILQELQVEPRLTMTELGRRVGLSSPSVTERVRRLEESEVIKGYSLDLNPAALGLPIGVYIRIRPNSGKLSIIAELALSIPEVVECHRVTGEDCFILKVYIPAIDQLDRILDQFLLYGSTTTTIIQSSPVTMRPLPLGENDDNVRK
ncbi:Lrp/AsnC family transcriptional regulator [Oceanobacillus jeddahense]|uniref:Lrp/AsnC family transcriptional regulator n=1 Tax=Oceanobacillus jeddahense TaxID=1462527 RepID=UPI0009DF08BF|nr:Lrp/AsnC family transcriptional regulator [Oceanobacillus jeddahense]